MFYSVDVSFWLHGCCKWEGLALINRFENTSWVAVVTPMLVRNSFVIEVLVTYFLLLSRCFLDFSVGVGAFIIGRSQIFSPFSDKKSV